MKKSIRNEKITENNVSKIGKKFLKLEILLKFSNKLNL